MMSLLLLSSFTGRSGETNPDKIVMEVPGKFGFSQQKNAGNGRQSQFQDVPRSVLQQLKGNVRLPGRLHFQNHDIGHAFTVCHFQGIVATFDRNRFLGKFFKNDAVSNIDSKKIRQQRLPAFFNQHFPCNVIFHNVILSIRQSSFADTCRV